MLNRTTQGRPALASPASDVMGLAMTAKQKKGGPGNRTALFPLSRRPAGHRSVTLRNDHQSEFALPLPALRCADEDRL